MYRIIEAIQENNYYLVDYYINEKDNLDCIDSIGRTPLMYAVLNEHELIIDLLLRNKVNINIKDKDNKKTALHYAVEKNNISICKKLIEKGISLSEQDSMKFTPLHYSIMHGDSEIASLLIKSGADIGNRGQSSITPLHMAAKIGLNTVISELLLYGANIDPVDFHYRTPLHISALNGNLISVYLLLKYGANILKTDLDDYDVLQLACIANKYEVVVSLLDTWEASPFNIGSNNNSTLHCAVKSGNINIVKKIIKNISIKKGEVLDLNYCSNYGTPLHECIDKKEIGEYLLQQGARPNIQGRDGFIPLHLACKWIKGNDLEFIDTLMYYGSELNAQCNRGNTPLHCAIYSRKYNVVEKLLHYNPDLNIKNFQGEKLKDLLNNLY